MKTTFSPIARSLRWATLLLTLALLTLPSSAFAWSYSASSASQVNSFSSISGNASGSTTSGGSARLSTSRSGSTITIKLSLTNLPFGSNGTLMQYDPTCYVANTGKIEFTATIDASKLSTSGAPFSSPITCSISGGTGASKKSSATSSSWSGAPAPNSSTGFIRAYSCTNGTFQITTTSTQLIYKWSGTWNEGDNALTFTIPLTTLSSSSLAVEYYPWRNALNADGVLPFVIAPNRTDQFNAVFLPIQGLSSSYRWFGSSDRYLGASYLPVTFNYNTTAAIYWGSQYGFGTFVTGTLTMGNYPTAYSFTGVTTGGYKVSYSCSSMPTAGSGEHVINAMTASPQVATSGLNIPNLYADYYYSYGGSTFVNPNNNTKVIPHMIFDFGNGAKVYLFRNGGSSSSTPYPTLNNGESCSISESTSSSTWYGYVSYAFTSGSTTLHHNYPITSGNLACNNNGKYTFSLTDILGGTWKSEFPKESGGTINYFNSSDGNGAYTMMEITRGYASWGTYDASINVKRPSIAHTDSYGRDYGYDEVSHEVTNIPRTSAFLPYHGGSSGGSSWIRIMPPFTANKSTPGKPFLGTNTGGTSKSGPSIQWETSNGCDNKWVYPTRVEVSTSVHSGYLTYTYYYTSTSASYWSGSPSGGRLCYRFNYPIIDAPTSNHLYQFHGMPKTASSPTSLYQVITPAERYTSTINGALLLNLSSNNISTRGFAGNGTYYLTPSSTESGNRIYLYGSKANVSSVSSISSPDQLIEGTYTVSEEKSGSSMRKKYTFTGLTAFGYRINYTWYSNYQTVSPLSIRTVNSGAATVSADGNPNWSYSFPDATPTHTVLKLPSTSSCQIILTIPNQGTSTAALPAGIYKFGTSGANRFYGYIYHAATVSGTSNGTSSTSLSHRCYYDAAITDGTLIVTKSGSTTRYQAIVKDEYGGTWWYNWDAQVAIEAEAIGYENLPNIPVWDWNANNETSYEYLNTIAIDLQPIIGNNNPSDYTIVHPYYFYPQPDNTRFGAISTTSYKNCPITADRLRSDGTYAVTLGCYDRSRDAATPSLNAYNKTLVVLLKKGSTVVAKLVQKPPYIILSNASGTCSGPAADVFISNGANITFRGTSSTGYNFMLAPKAKLTAEEAGSTFTAKSLILMGDNDETAEVKVGGTLNLSSGNIIVAHRTDNQHFYFSALPENHTVSDVRNFDIAQGGLNGLCTAVNNNTLNSTFSAKYTQGSDYLIKFYDGAARSTNGGVVSNWVAANSNDVIPAGKGFIIATSDTRPKTLGFIMSASSTLQTTKTVPVEDYGIDLYLDHQIPASDVGWNLVGDPFIAEYKPTGARPLVYGQLLEDNEYEEFAGDQTVAYITETEDFGADYVQRKITTEHIHPFHSYFVQVGNPATGHQPNLKLSFSNANTGWYAPQRAEEIVDQEVSLLLAREDVDSAAYSQEQTTLLIANHYSDQYDFQADLAKMMNKGKRVHLYTLSGDQKLAFNALPEASATGTVPVGFYAPASGSYSISLADVPTDKVEAVYLTDYELGVTTNLMTSPYLFTSSKMENKTRFALSCVMAPAEVPTELVETQGSPVYVYRTGGNMSIFGLTEGDKVSVYGITGQLVFNGTAHTERMDLPAPEPSYIIRVVRPDGVHTLRL